MRRIASPPLLDGSTAGLTRFVDAGILDAAAIHVAGTIARNVPGTPVEVLLAAALATRALGLGHICVELARATEIALDDALAGLEDPGHDDGDAGADARSSLPWPDREHWAGVLRSAAAVHVRDPVTGLAGGGDGGDDHLRPLVFDGDRVYLERYWRYERAVGDDLLARVGDTNGKSGPGALDEVLDRLFGTEGGGPPDLQRRAAAVALTRRLAVLAGGPGTGKTYTVARLLAAAHQLALEAGRPLEVALAAPTGKAAARMTEAVHEAVAAARLPTELAEPVLATEARTLHRLLGYRDRVRFRHDRGNPLPHDLVVVDETSMVALPLMARLLDALRPDARLVLVGDPNQLASVEAGAVLGDVVGPVARGEPGRGPLAPEIVVLERAHRFAADSGIAAFADAVRTGDAERALDVLRDADRSEVRWIDPADEARLEEIRELAAGEAALVTEAALAGEAELGFELAQRFKVLCATRFGDHGSHAWRDRIERSLIRRVRGLSISERWYVGRPVIVTRNDYLTNVFNGDTGLVVRDGERRVVVMDSLAGLRRLAPSQLDAVDTWWAMTIHKSQGSEFAHAVVSLPTHHSPVLTRELLYTGITRGKRQVTIVATEESLRFAIGRPVARASGLQRRLWPDA